MRSSTRPDQPTASVQASSHPPVRMVKLTKSPVTYARMKGILSYFSALIREKRFGSSGLLQKPGSRAACCRIDSECFFLRPEGSVCDEAGAAALGFTSATQELQRSRASAADFDYLKIIGTGSFGKVLLARHKKSDSYYAVKVYQKHVIFKKKADGHVMSERNVLLKTINHPFLARLHFSFQTKERLYLVLDYAGGGELFYHLQRERAFAEPRARFYAAEMACALGYLHSLHIVYRDLKPENILLDAAGHVVLTDFGLCKEGIVGRATTQTFCGTPEYLAPEVLQQREYDRTVDWWGLGAVLHEMLYGLPPFYSADRMVMLSNIMFQPLVLKTGVSKAGKDLLKRLLNRDRAKRLGAKHDVAEVQHHSFFSSIQWDNLVAKKIRPPFIPSLVKQAVTTNEGCRGAVCADGTLLMGTSVVPLAVLGFEPMTFWSQSGPDDLTNVDPAFTNLPVPRSLAVCEEADTAFPGFSYTSQDV